MCRDLTPLLFHEEDLDCATQKRKLAVTTAKRCNLALVKKLGRKHTPQRCPVMEFQELMTCLSTVIQSQMQLDNPGAVPCP